MYSIIEFRFDNSSSLSIYQSTWLKIMELFTFPNEEYDIQRWLIPFNILGRVKLYLFTFHQKKG